MRGRRVVPFGVSTLLAVAMLPAVAAGAAAGPVSVAAGVRVLQSSAGSPEETVATYLRSQGYSDSVIGSLRVDARVPGNAGVVHLRISQAVDGEAVVGGYAKAAIDASGALVNLVDRLVPVGARGGARVPASAALRAAVVRSHPGAPSGLPEQATQGATTTFAADPAFQDPPTATRVLLPTPGGGLSRGWLVTTWTSEDNLLVDTVVGGLGQVQDTVVRTSSDTYNVFAEDPGKNAQAPVAGPGAGTPGTPSPVGWLSGSQFTTLISGNNATSYIDLDANNRPDPASTPVATGVFDSTADLGVSPTTPVNQAVSVQNLFWLNNRIHDILYAHGFNEAAGNFQVDNFGNGGRGTDPVNAEAQDGSGTDNANMATPSDGSSPRMQMYLWTPLGGTHEVVAGASTYDAYGADFGSKLTTAGLTGPLKLATPADGCTAVTGVQGGIAVVDRGSCDFSTKVLNAQNAGALGVIVANNVPGGFTMAAGAGARKVRIPAVMVDQADGTAIKVAAGDATIRVKAVQPPQIDASLDSDIVYHEYCHGLTWRMIGGMSGQIAGAIGEGMSDGCALLINGGNVVAEYSASDPGGIRRWAYDAYPVSVTYESVEFAEVHDGGEVYAAIIWKLIQHFDAEGARDRLFTWVVDGMNYTPSKPAFEDMRDGILASIANSGATDAVKAADTCAVWSEFAARGVGDGADGIVVKSRGISTAQITESYSLPEGAC